MKDRNIELTKKGFKAGNSYSVRGASARWQKGLGLEYGEEDSNFNDDFHFAEISRKQPPKSEYCPKKRQLKEDDKFAMKERLFTRQQIDQPGTHEEAEPKSYSNSRIFSYRKPPSESLSMLDNQDQYVKVRSFLNFISNDDVVNKSQRVFKYFTENEETFDLFLNSWMKQLINPYSSPAFVVDIQSQSTIQKVLDKILIYQALEKNAKCNVNPLLFYLWFYCE